MTLVPRRFFFSITEMSKVLLELILFIDFFLKFFKFSFGIGSGIGIFPVLILSC